MNKEKFLKYEEIRKSGRINVCIVSNVVRLSNGILTENDCYDIMDNYYKYEKEFLEDQKIILAKDKKGNLCLITNRDINKKYYEVIKVLNYFPIQLKRIKNIKKLDDLLDFHLDKINQLKIENKKRKDIIDFQSYKLYQSEKEVKIRKDIVSKLYKLKKENE